MENNKTYLKTDESKMKEFGTGAMREDKTGKGRYDLIPGDIMSDFEDFVWEEYFKNGTTTCSSTDVSKSAYFDDWKNVELYYDFMFNVVSLFFVPSIDREECEDDNGEISYEITWDGFRAGLYVMRNALAKHYEEGAKIHGIDNWKKGLPVYGSQQGGCFLDSMRRHTDQALQGKDDEPHAVAAVWNAFGAIWTLKHRKHSAMYQNASAVKAERYDQVDSLASSILGCIFDNGNGDWRSFDGNDKIVEETKTTMPSSDNKFNITKWPEGVDIEPDNLYHVCVGNDILGKEIQMDRNLADIDLPIGDGFNNIIDNAQEAHLADVAKRIKEYHDIKYNLANTIEILRKIINSKNFSRRGDLVKRVYFDIYTALVILYDIIACFHEYPDDMTRIGTIVSDAQCLINQNVGRIHECCGNITLKWESCPNCKYEYIIYPGEPNEDKLHILYETIERVIVQLTNTNENLDTFRSLGMTLDTFRGLGILTSLADFNNTTLKPRINNTCGRKT